ncbi:hypothetical protein CJF42_23750 [Pseudoalteromonas sp. NBT06-2]|uniref:hypothetical protein n=1 Tax=Pseudoalteromonas sp. NBT06-2 TaxID=2025950 RepID=UPI000BA5FB70|nr:hypothetical protein [Pseudoalteromonas sp. NBT06-2]PAJ71969.1 hypothetical protein CJF42_23750 [Pseudoalteromonas sp. NBT06-2]
MDVKKSIRTTSTSNTSKLEYKDAQAKLAVASLPLTFKNTTIKQLGGFITAALAVHDVCRDKQMHESPLDVLFWLRQRLKKETKNVERDELYRAHCLRQIDKVERKIAIACVKHSQGSLTILE